MKVQSKHDSKQFKMDEKKAIIEAENSLADLLKDFASTLSYESTGRAVTFEEADQMIKKAVENDEDLDDFLEWYFVEFKI